jgi:hypothetical protein
MNYCVIFMKKNSLMTLSCFSYSLEGYGNLQRGDDMPVIGSAMFEALDARLTRQNEGRAINIHYDGGLGRDLNSESFEYVNSESFEYEEAQLLCFIAE